MSSLTDPVQLVRDRLAALNINLKRDGKQYNGRCPSHSDERPSFGLSRGEDGRALVNCRAGCSVDQICAALGIATRDLYPPKESSGFHNPGWEVIATYDYKDADGRLLYQRVRYRNKVFLYRSPVGDGAWRYGLYAGWFEQKKNGDWRIIKGLNKDRCDDPDKKPRPEARWFDAITERVLYQEHRIREAQPGDMVLVLEGEKDADTATRLGFIATTAGSSSDWRDSFAELFTDLDMVIVPDNDAAGEKLTRKIASACYGVAGALRVLRLPGLEEKEDFTDWVESCEAEDMTAEQMRARFLALCDDVWPYQPEVASDELTERAIEEAKRAIGRAEQQLKYEDTDPSICEDAKIDSDLRYTAREGARLLKVTMLIMAGLGFEGNHRRILDALISYAVKLPNMLVYFSANHLAIYSLFGRTKQIKDRSKTALVGAEIAALRKEQNERGARILDYVHGNRFSDKPGDPGYSSRFRLQILRYALIAIRLADSAKTGSDRRWQVDEWAASMVAEMIPRREPVASVSKNRGKAEKRVKAEEDFESIKKKFMEAAELEFNRLANAEIAKCGSAEALSDSVDELEAELINKIRRIASQARVRGVAEIAARQSEEKQYSEINPMLTMVHESMDLQEPQESEQGVSSDDVPVLRNDITLRSMPGSDDSGVVASPIVEGNKPPPELPQANATRCDSCKAPMEWGSRYCPGCGAIYEPIYWKAGQTERGEGFYASD